MFVRHFVRSGAICKRFFVQPFHISSALKMPPKKKEEEKTPLMGRFGTSLKCGIVGIPNVG
jgi:hypothetical protein